MALVCRASWAARVTVRCATTATSGYGWHRAALRAPGLWPIAKALSRLPPPLVSASIPGPRALPRPGPGDDAGHRCRAPWGLFLPDHFFLLQVRRNTAPSDAAARAPAVARGPHAFGRPHADRRVRLVCLRSGPDPKADGLLERPGEAFCPAKFIKLRSEGLASGPDPALGAIAPVIDARSTRRQPRNPFAGNHAARRRRRFETKGAVSGRTGAHLTQTAPKFKNDDPPPAHAARGTTAVRQPRAARAAGPSARLDVPGRRARWWRSVRAPLKLPERDARHLSTACPGWPTCPT